MPTTTSRQSNGSRRGRILKYLSSEGGRIDSADGRGLTSKMAAKVGYDNIAALNAILARLERDGEIKRVVRGKRTYSIALRSPTSRSARPKAGVTKARAGTRKAARTTSGRAPAGRARPVTRKAARPAPSRTRTATRKAARTTAGRAPVGRARTATRKAARTPTRRTVTGRSVAAPNSRRGSVRSGPNRRRGQTTRATGAGTNLPLLLTALGNELLALRQQNQEMSRRIAALEAGARPATRRAGGRRAA